MMMVVVVGWLGWVGWVGGMHEILTPHTLKFLCAYQLYQYSMSKITPFTGLNSGLEANLQFSTFPYGGPPKITKFWQTWIWVQEMSSSPLINLSGGGE